MNYTILLQISSLLITFATILSHYWIIKMKLNDLDFRIRAIEKNNFEELDKKIYRIEIIDLLNRSKQLFKHLFLL